MTLSNIVFLGSSSEASPAATAIKALLEEANIPVRLWTDVFKAGEIVLDRLLQEATTAHYGIFIFSTDDTTTIRGMRFSTPRDNVIFETGMFMGIKGRNRVFIIVPTAPLSKDNFRKHTSRKHILSDIAGLVYLTYTPPKNKRSIDAWKVALAHTCSNLLENIRADRTESRIRSLNGQWLGTFCQRSTAKGQPKTRSIQGSFIVSDEHAHGHFSVMGLRLPNSDRDLELILTGKLLYDHFIRIDYQYPTLGPIQFGSAVLKLDATSTKLSGEFVGYGALAQRIVSGTLRLQKSMESHTISIVERSHPGELTTTVTNSRTRGLAG